MLSACILLCIWALADLNENPCNESPPCIPKSRRSWMHKLWRNHISPAVSQLGTKIANAIGNWDTAKTDRERGKKSRQTSKETETPCLPHRRKRLPGMGRTLTTLMLHSTVAMSTAGAFGDPIKDNVVQFDTDSRRIGVDNGASACVSHDKNDFVGPLEPVNMHVQGFGGHRTRNVMRGTLRWSWLDDQGQAHAFRIPRSYCVPEGKARLLSPQHWAKTQKDAIQNGTGEFAGARNVQLAWNGRKNQLTVPLGKNNNVATIHMAPGYEKFTAFCAETGIDYDDDAPLICHDVGIVSDDEDDDEVNAVPEAKSMFREHFKTAIQHAPAKRKNKEIDGVTALQDGIPVSEGVAPIELEFDLNASGTTMPAAAPDEEDRQKLTSTAELLMCHHRFGHVSFEKLQIMAKQGMLPARLANCNKPACSACLFGKAMRRSKGTKRRKTCKPQAAKKPGETVSVDMLVSPAPGLIAQISGKLATKRYEHAAVFIDNCSRLSYVHLQKTSTAEETIEAKKAFESHASQHGVEVLRYHADNGMFGANKWVAECEKSKQALTFAGVNAHQANGFAEARIRRLQELARTMLIHATKRWPGSVSINLWPFALRVANDATNETPSLQDEKRRAPLQTFAKTEVNINPKHWKTFGSPGFVLKEPLQRAGAMFHEWRDGSKVGMCLGRSPQHSRNVALMLDRTTGLVSPQFHAVFDPTFGTVRDDKSFKSTWQTQAGFVNREIGKSQNQGNNKHHENKTIIDQTSESKDKGRRPNRNHKRHGRKPKRIAPRGAHAEGEVEAQQQSLKESERTDQQSPTKSPDEEEKSDENQVGIAPVHLHKRDPGKRQPKPVKRLIQVFASEIMAMTENTEVPGEIMCFSALAPYAGELSPNPLLAYKATADPDTMHVHEAMREPDKDKFKQAMEKEWKDQIENGNFIAVPRNKVPEGATILPAAWQMKRKRDIRTREIKKHKARLNIDGSRMKQGIHHDQTCSPVASWNSMRTLLTLTAPHGWKTQQIDHALAFPQAPVERDICMNVPKGFEIEEGNTKDFALQLHRNVCGQKQASRVWCECLAKKLVGEVGFRQSAVDECAFYKGKVMHVLCTDDSMLAGPDQSEIDKIAQQIKDAKLNITIEGTLEDFLGVNISRKKDGTMHLTQPHLIDQILNDLGMKNENVKIKKAPASSSKLLSRHSDSKDFDNSFHHRSIIGKLNHLEKATRPDIACITHQCARFTACPKKEHGDAIRWLARCLKGTRDKGAMCKPVNDKELEVHVDADFAGNWDPEEWRDPDTSRSRHGHMIVHAGCPLLWKSQLQTEHALSSTESEHAGLSHALRDAIPIVELLKEMKRRGFPAPSSQAKVHCKAFEDNSGALEIAKNPKFRPRTKHLNNKLHHFRHCVDDLKEITIHKIDTEIQPGDYLTKPLNEILHARHRLHVQGW